MINKLKENMIRFRTKNLQEQSQIDQNQQPPVGNPYEFTAGIHELEPKDVYQRLHDREGLQPGTTITPEEIADVLDYADGTFNDKEAYIQSAFAAIKDANELRQVFQSLKRSFKDYINKVFGGITAMMAIRDGGTGVLDIDYHDNGKIPTIKATLDRLGVSDQIDY